MPDYNYTDITFVLDRSGSMSRRRAETIEGFNSFIEEQRSKPGRATVSLFQFDNHFDTQSVPTCTAFEGVPLEQVMPLDSAGYVPRGYTALRDAMGRTVDMVGRRLAGMPEHLRPGKVVVVVISDGEENASKEYDQYRLAQMVRHQQDAYNWNFIFIGTNQDSVLVAKSYGIGAGNAMNYSDKLGGTKALYEAVSGSVGNYRSMRGISKHDTFATDAVVMSCNADLKSVNADKLGELNVSNAPTTTTQN